MRYFTLVNLLHRCILLIPIILVLPSVAGFAQESILLKRAIVIDGTGRRPLARAMILIDGPTIKAVGLESTVMRNGEWVEVIQTDSGAIDVPPDAVVFDLQNLYVIPGLIDCHVHVESPRDLGQMLAWGITSVNAMFESTDDGLRTERETASDVAAAPQVYSTAPIFSVTNGWWYGDAFPNDSTIDRFPATAAEARAQVQRAKRKGISRIKLMYDDMRWCRDTLSPMKRMEASVMRALVDEARKQQLFVEVHAPMLRDAREALRAGVSAFAHGILDEPLDSSFVRTMNERGVYYAPTIGVFEFLAAPPPFVGRGLSEERFRSALPQDVLDRYQSSEYFAAYRLRYPNSPFVQSKLPTLSSNLRTLSEAGARVVLGTDMWAFPGIGAHLEMESMVRAGMQPMQVLQAATKTAAEFLGQAERVGTIEAGKQADLVILRQNPIVNIRNTRSIWKILKQGTFHDHDALIERSKQ